MRVTRHINISDIRVDRYPINPSTLQLVDFLRSGGLVPPIHVAVRSTGGYLIKDGRHRLLANKLLGMKTIEARFSTVPMRSKSRQINQA